MTIGLAALVKADAAVAALLGTQMYPLVPPKDVQGTYCLYQLITDPSRLHLRGVVSLRFARVQFSVWDSRYLGADPAAEAIRHVLDGFKGALPDGTTVSSCVCDSFEDAYDSVALRYGVQADYIVSFRSTT